MGCINAERRRDSHLSRDRIEVPADCLEETACRRFLLRSLRSLGRKQAPWQTLRPVPCIVLAWGHPARRLAPEPRGAFALKFRIVES